MMVQEATCAAQEAGNNSAVEDSSSMHI